MGVQRVLLPRSLRGVVGSGMAAGPDLWHPQSILDSLPEAQSHSERPFWAVPAFRRVLQSAALKTFVQGLWPAQHRAKVRGGGGRDVHLPELAAPDERTHTLGQQADAVAQQHQGTPGNAAARQPQGDKCVGKHQRQAVPQPALPRQPSPSSSAGTDAAPAKASPAACKLPAQLPLVE